MRRSLLLIALVACGRVAEVNDEPPSVSQITQDAETPAIDAATVDAAADVIVDASAVLEDAGACTTTPETQKLCFGREHPDFGTSFRAHCSDEATKAVPFCILDELVGCWCCP